MNTTPEPYHRAYMSFREVRYGPYTITLMEGDEPGYCERGPLLVSVEGPGLPTLRLTTEGSAPLRDGDGEQLAATQGVLVFGSWKGDRPRLGAPEKETP